MSIKQITSGIAALLIASALPISAAAEVATVIKTAPAAADTRLEMSVQPAYTVTIPAKVELKGTTGIYQGSGDVTAENVRLGFGQQLIVGLSGEDGFELKNSADEKVTLPYTPSGSFGTISKSGGNVAVFGVSDKKQTVTVSFITDTAPEYAGSYSDTVVFDISIGSEGINVVTAEGQSIGTPGIVNARELGGYKMMNGKTVKRGLLLRTAKLSTASAEDIAALKDKYNLGYVVDMRTEGEAASAPDPEIEGVEEIFTPIDLTACLNELSSAATPEERKAILERAYENGGLGSMMYVNALKDEETRKQYRRFFDTLLAAKGEKAVLWHCSMGKDRTGMGAAMILTVLGADEETIMQDFMLTNLFYEGSYESALASAQKMFPNDPDLAAAIAELSSGVKEENLRAVLNYMKEESGSVEAFIRDKIGVTDEEMDLLRSYYLTDQ